MYVFNVIILENINYIKYYIICMLYLYVTGYHSSFYNFSRRFIVDLNIVLIFDIEKRVNRGQFIVLLLILIFNIFGSAV